MIEKSQELSFMTLQEAWEEINMMLAQGHPAMLQHGGGVHGTEYIAYDVLVRVNSSKIDPNFNFGKVLGYTDKKWTSLVKNYVDFDYLDLVKSEITMRRGKDAKSYNYTFRFSNKHGGGKDCLIALIFSKRIGDEYPTAFFNVRVSEVTSRLIFDFLLVQRIVEYVYGEDHPVHVNFFAPSLFVTAERFSMFAHWKGWEKTKKRIKGDGTGKFYKRVNTVYNHFMNTPSKDIKYKTHARCSEVLRKEGHKANQDVFARDLKLIKLEDELPIEANTPSKVRKHKLSKNKK